jgi:hypothetical protein
MNSRNHSTFLKKEGRSRSLRIEGENGKDRDDEKTGKAREKMQRWGQRLKPAW